MSGLKESAKRRLEEAIAHRDVLVSLVGERRQELVRSLDAAVEVIESDPTKALELLEEAKKVSNDLTHVLLDTTAAFRLLGVCEAQVKMYEEGEGA